MQLAEKAHRHALETMQEKQSRWWVTPLPEDLAEPLVDVRHVQAPPPFLSENLDPQDDPFLVPGLGGCVTDWAACLPASTARKASERPDLGLGCSLSCRFDEDEASLWWYAYARKNVAGPKQAVPAQDDTGPGGSTDTHIMGTGKAACVATAGLWRCCRRGRYPVPACEAGPAGAAGEEHGGPAVAGGGGAGLGQGPGQDRHEGEEEEARGRRARQGGRGAQGRGQEVRPTPSAH